MKVLQNLAVKLGITRAEMTAVSLLLLFLVIGGVVRYGTSVQQADHLIRQAERARFSEAEVDSLLRLVPSVDYTAVAGAEELPKGNATTEDAEDATPRARTSRLPKKLFTGVIAFNRASAGQLQQIPGVGPAIAKRLIAFRTEKGGKVLRFDDFLDVKGIGRKKLEVLKKHLTLE